MIRWPADGQGVGKGQLHETPPVVNTGRLSRSEPFHKAINPSSLCYPSQLHPSSYRFLTRFTLTSLVVHLILYSLAIREFA